MSRLEKPNFYILGAAKAGTTTLYDVLEKHPQVYMPYDKEPGFFSDVEYYARGQEWYLESFFSQASGQPWRGEATSRYLALAEKVAPRIRQFHQGERPRFVVIFRDPVKLVNSFYWHSVREGRESLPLAQALEQEESRMAAEGNAMRARGLVTYAYRQIGNFASQLEGYFALFPREDFLFFLTEDLADMAMVRQRMADFFGLDPFGEAAEVVQRNAAALPRMRWLHTFLRGRSMLKDAIKPILPAKLRFALKEKVIASNLQAFSAPPMEPEMASALRQHYAGEVRRLQEMIGRDLGAWLGEG